MCRSWLKSNPLDIYMGLSFATGENKFYLLRREAKKSEEKYMDYTVLCSLQRGYKPTGRLLHIYESISHILTLIRASYLKSVMLNQYFNRFRHLFTGSPHFALQTRWFRRWVLATRRYVACLTASHSSLRARSPVLLEIDWWTDWLGTASARQQASCSFITLQTPLQRFT